MGNEGKASGEQAATSSSSAIFTFSHRPEQISALRQLCHAWEKGPEAFWSFDFVMAALTRPGALAFFVADHANAAWEACLFADAGPFTADLLYIYVRPECRRLGYGQQLLLHLVAALKQMPKMESLLLEVRLSNVAAQTLYRRLGMRHIHTRKAYYRDGEDAHIYILELNQ